MSTNQSTNSSFVPLRNQLVSQVVRWSFYQSINQSIHQSVSDSLSHSILFRLSRFAADFVFILFRPGSAFCTLFQKKSNLLTTAIRLKYTATAWQYWCVLNLASIYRHWSRRATIDVTVVQTCKPEKCAHTIWIRTGNPVSTRLFFEQRLCITYI